LRESGTARLEEAVTAYRAALEENTHERVPLEWAKTQVGLGMALYSIGERESGTARLEQAAAAFRAALEENTRERVPLEWARTYTNLGNALLVWGSRESETARLKDAVTAYSAALEENTRERVPLDWATAFGMQGAARMNLAARTKDTEVAERALLQEIALQQIKEAFDAMRAAGHPDAAHFEALLSGASQFRASTTPPPTIHHKLAPTINNKTISIMKSMTGRPR
jgi:tetratricopeptide (TPR) repeat protein